MRASLLRSLLAFKPLSGSNTSMDALRRLCTSSTSLAHEQGLTLVYFSAQPEPFLTLSTSPKRLNNPSNPALNTHTLTTPCSHQKRLR